MKKIAIVTGATGAIGQSLLSQLIDSGIYSQIHTFGRKHPARTEIILASHLVNLESVEDIYDTLLKQIKHYSALDKTQTKNTERAIDIHIDCFCVLGTTIKQAGNKNAFKQVDFHFVVNFAKAIKKLADANDEISKNNKQTINSFNVVSAIGANNTSSIFYNQVKGEMEEALINLRFSTLNIFRPSLLHGKRDDFRFKEAMSYGILLLLSPLLQGKAKKYRAINISDVANAMFKQAQLNLKGVHTFESDEIKAIANH